MVGVVRVVPVFYKQVLERTNHVPHAHFKKDIYCQWFFILFICGAENLTR